MLEKSMEVKKREDGTEFTCFSDTATEELKDLYLEHYEVRDLAYKIFSTAIDTIIEAYENNEKSVNLLYVLENYNDFASPYNADRLAYLNVWNDEDIARIFKDFSCESISMACAIWYDEQVKDAMVIIIREFLTK